MTESNQGGNMKSLPHVSKQNGDHLDVYSHVEGQAKPQKFHLPLGQAAPAEPTSIEGLRIRLGIQKG